MSFKVGDKVEWSKERSIRTITKRLTPGEDIDPVWELDGTVHVLESELEKFSDAPPPGTPTMEDTLKLTVETLVERMRELTAEIKENDEERDIHCSQIADLKAQLEGQGKVAGEPGKTGRRGAKCAKCGTVIYRAPSGGHLTPTGERCDCFLFNPADEASEAKAPAGTWEERAKAAEAQVFNLKNANSQLIEELIRTREARNKELPIDHHRKFSREMQEKAEEAVGRYAAVKRAYEESGRTLEQLCRDVEASRQEMARAREERDDAKAEAERLRKVLSGDAGKDQAIWLQQWQARCEKAEKHLGECMEQRDAAISRAASVIGGEKTLQAWIDRCGAAEDKVLPLEMNLKTERKERKQAEDALHALEQVSGNEIAKGDAKSRIIDALQKRVAELEALQVVAPPTGERSFRDDYYKALNRAQVAEDCVAKYEYLVEERNAEIGKLRSVVNGMVQDAQHFAEKAMGMAAGRAMARGEKIPGDDPKEGK